VSLVTANAVVVTVYTSSLTETLVTFMHTPFLVRQRQEGHQ